MKKTAILLLMLLCLCACGSKSAAFHAEDIALTVAGNSVTAETAVEDVLAMLGEDYAYAEAISCVYEGMDKTFSYENVTLYTYPDGETDRLMELYCTGGDVQTSKGIGLGASKSDVVAQYGEDYTEAGSILSYEVSAAGTENLPASLYFLMEDGQVTAIAITAEHRAE